VGWSKCGSKTALDAPQPHIYDKIGRDTTPYAGGHTRQQGENLAVVSERHGFIGTEFFAKSNPVIATVVSVVSTEREVAKGRIKDYRFTLENTFGVRGEMDVYGDNLNKVIRAQNDDEKWVGLRVRIGVTTIDGKRRRILDVL